MSLSCNSVQISSLGKSCVVCMRLCPLCSPCSSAHSTIISWHDPSNCRGRDGSGGRGCHICSRHCHCGKCGVCTVAWLANETAGPGQQLLRIKQVNRTHTIPTSSAFYISASNHYLPSLQPYDGWRLLPPAQLTSTQEYTSEYALGHSTHPITLNSASPPSLHPLPPHSSSLSLLTPHPPHSSPSPPSPPTGLQQC